MATKETLSEIKRNLESYVGQKVLLRTNKGRKKVKVREGIILEVYPSLFVVQIDDGMQSERKITYSYSDILTETVEVTVSSSEERIYIS